MLCCCCPWLVSKCVMYFWVVYLFLLLLNLLLFQYLCLHLTMCHLCYEKQCKYTIVKLCDFTFRIVVKARMIKSNFQQNMFLQFMCKGCEMFVLRMIKCTIWNNYQNDILPIFLYYLYCNIGCTPPFLLINKPEVLQKQVQMSLYQNF